MYLDEGIGAPITVGSLRASFRGGRRLGGSSFEYSPEYLASPARYAISPDLPLVSGRMYSNEHTPLFGAFADATPDVWGTEHHPMLCTPVNDALSSRSQSVSLPMATRPGSATCRR
ncbi:HipA N-terminal domain-containing protein [Agromyces sp. Root81]|uniref:HipA N-terminal domain-containing protein n=1 Tax=Agromyces sp. Root81 TaxID=1736601 RepID=UPI00138F02B7